MQNVILIKLAIPVRKSSFHQSHKQWHLDLTELTQEVADMMMRLTIEDKDIKVDAHWVSLYFLLIEKNQDI